MIKAWKCDVSRGAGKSLKFWPQLAIVGLGFATGLMGTSTLQAFECAAKFQPVDNTSYCGTHRGNYVLRANGNALFVAADGADDKAELIVRTPGAAGTAAEAQERVLARYGDVMPFGGGTTIRLGGIGSNPHMNSAGQAIFDVSNSYYDGEGPAVGEGEYWLYSSYYEGVKGMYVADAGGAPNFVAGGGFELGTTGRSICSEGLQPWPQIGPSGHFVFSAEVEDSQGLCSPATYGDADSYNQIDYSSPDDAMGAIATVTRVVAGPLADPTDNTSQRDIDIYFEPLDGEVPADWTGNILVYGLVGIGSPYDQSFFFRQNAIENFGFSDSEVDTVANSISVDGFFSDFFAERVCPPAGCDIVLAERGWSAFLSDSQVAYNGYPGDPGIVNARSSGVRYVTRGRIGSSTLEVPVKSAIVTGPGDAPTLLSVPSRDVYITPGNPLESGAINFVTRAASTITAAADVVADDGSFLVWAAVQDRLTDNPFKSDALQRLAATEELRGFGYRNGVVHVNASGSAQLVAATTSSRRQIGKPLMMANGDVLYRATFERGREDDWTYTSQEACIRFGTGIWKSAADTPTAFPLPTGYNGSWPTMDVGDTFFGTYSIGLVNADTGATLFSDNVNSRDNSVVVIYGSDNPTETYLEITSTRQQRFGGYYCGSAADVNEVKALMDSGKARISIPAQRVADATFTPNTYSTSDRVWFEPSNVQVDYRTAVDGVTTYTVEGGLRRWSSSNGATTDVFEFDTKSPGGFSVMRGLPPHYDAGNGVIAFKTQLWHEWYPWDAPEGPDNPLPVYDANDIPGTLAGLAEPCEGDLSLPQDEVFWSDDSGHVCHAVMMSQNGTMSEIARTKRADLVYGAWDDASAVGVTEADGFEFYELDAGIAVSDSGTVFFNATSFQDVSALLPGQEEGDACTRDDIIGGTEGGINGVFAYSGGQVRKVLAEMDVITDGFGQTMTILAIATPQPEMRQAVAGDVILLKFAADTTGDCAEDMVGLIASRTPQSVEALPPQEGVGGVPPQYEAYPEVGTFTGISTGQGGRVTLRATTTGWVVTEFDALDPSSAEYLSAEQMNGALMTFTAIYNPTRLGENPSVDEGYTDTVEMEMQLDAAPGRVLDLIKDLDGAPSLNPTVSEGANGGALVAFSIVDAYEGQSGEAPFDFNDAQGVIIDPFGASLNPLPMLQGILPVPFMSNPFLVMLGGMIVLLAGVFRWRGRAV